jgi:hypothetical protein
MASKACLCLAFLLALLALHEAQGLSFTASGEDWSADLYNTLTEAYLYTPPSPSPSSFTIRALPRLTTTL